MSSSLIPSCITALVSSLTTAFAGAIPVNDGPVLQNTEPAMLLVGATEAEGLSSGDFPEWQQRWAGLGHAARDETFQIPCVLFVRSGDTDLATYRTTAWSYFATVESTLRNDPTLGISTNTIRAQVSPGSYSQPQTPDGVVCRIDFTVNVEGRI